GKKTVDIMPYIERNNCNVIISKKPVDIGHVNNEVQQITYSTDIKETYQTAALYLFDLPPNLTCLKQIIEQIKPKQIHLCFYIEKSIYLTTFPSREDFKWLY